MSNEKRAPGCLGCLGGYTPLCYRVYKDPIVGIPSLNSQDSMESKARFFFRGSNELIAIPYC